MDTSISCHIAPTISNEQFIPDHFVSYLVSGSLILYDTAKEYKIQPGDYCFAKRNHLARYIKHAPPNGKFETITLWFRQDSLRLFSQEYSCIADTAIAVATAPAADNDAIVRLRPNPLLDNFFHSVKPYLQLAGKEPGAFLALKEKEILLILLKIHPELKNVLFNFSDPGKIDLEAFMLRNYKFNVSMNRFGYLTGRSLTTFKRDFERIFHQAPGRWLLEKRLEEAHFLLEKKGQTPSDVCFEVGFEDLSHFSYASKKRYGVSPRALRPTPPAPTPAAAR